MTPGQLPLAFETRTAFSESDFVVGAANARAWDWLSQWPGWPGRMLALHGPAGSGKTHLLNIWAKRTNGRLIDGAKLDLEMLGHMAPGPVALDNGEAAPEQALFHLINLQRERGEGLLISLPDAPSYLRIQLPDLASRLGAMPLAPLSPPDDEMLAAVLVKQFSDRQLRATEDVTRFLLSRMTRSFAAAREVVAALDQAAMAEKRNITVPLAREVLARLMPES